MAQLEQVLILKIESAHPMPAEEANQLRDLANLGSGLPDFWGRLCGILGDFEVQKASPLSRETSFTQGLVRTSGHRVSTITGAQAADEGPSFLRDLTSSRSDAVAIDGKPGNFYLKTGPDGGLAVHILWATPPYQTEARWVVPAEQLPAQPKL